MNNQFDVITIPSVFGTAPALLDNFVEKIHKGLKLKIENDFFMVGDLALNEGVQPHKEINSSPNDLDYKLLMTSALLVENSKLGNALTVTTGFPFASYQVNKDLALENLLKDHLVEFDSSIFSNGGVKKMVIEVSNGAILPEVSASAHAIRSIYKVEGDFMVLSLGFGTFETIYSNSNGEFGLQRTASSSQGIIYALQALRKELFNLYPSNMISDTFLDEALRNGYIFLDRKKVDIKDLRNKVLTLYYKNLISPTVKKAFTDREFSKSQGIYLAGGGALYPELVSMFKEEFKDIIDVQVLEDPQYLAAKGYFLRSSKLNGGNKAQSVGIDMGNSTTVVCSLEILNKCILNS
ncbi:MAG: ParM/StbA family protein [Algoriphagus sp.]|uniref:ParM/StbA family protein n=1 Tax=Algoriphagus sp. TaxID=1872435 RepID=UPI0026356197|nr:ParM/StbA family protein [Algoriphagus sp.]MDG1279226.1 ParM/StbA family protein [Algoriphagus sp.]